MEEVANILFQNKTPEQIFETIEIILSSEDSESSSSESCSDSEDESVNRIDFVEVIERYNASEFKSHMRMTPSTVQYLINRFKESEYFPKLCHGGKQSLDAKKSVFIYIWYIVNTITFRQLGVLFGVAKSTAWIAVKRVSSFLLSIGHEYIKWPQGRDLTCTVRKFQQKRNIPGIVGAIDFTHISIRAPKNEKECYFDRKQNYSLVLQAVVDADKKFIDITCGEPGSLHDVRVLRRSDLYRRAESCYDELFPNNCFILGDSAYPPNRWIVPPFKDYGNLSESQKKFNQIHSSTRIVVENAFGLLKMRFRRLLKFTEQTNITTLTNIIVSACVLHNICITKDDLHDDEQDEFLYDEDVDQNSAMFEFADDSQRRDILFNYLLEQNIL